MACRQPLTRFQKRQSDSAYGEAGAVAAAGFNVNRSGITAPLEMIIVMA